MFVPGVNGSIIANSNAPTGSKLRGAYKNSKKRKMPNGGSVLSMGDYDVTTAPKKGDYLLPDINRPGYIDSKGGRRTEYKIGVNIDGKETLLPTVVGGKQLTKDEAINRYYKTGLNMGKFNTSKEADYASRLRTARYNMLEDPVKFQASQFRDGGTLPPIYTSNPRDPRIRNYQDSLNLYKEQNRLNILNDKTNYPQQSARPTINKNNLIYTGDPNKGGYVNPKIFSSNIPTFSKDIHGNLKQQYKKPVQPYIYRKPEVTPEVVETPLPVASIQQPVKKIGYNKPIIQQFNYMSNENKAKALQKYGSVGDIPFQGVDINQLRNGGKTSDDKQMVDGVASILRRVEDKQNRLKLANQLAKQFNREKVKYDLSFFLAKSKVKK